MSLTHYTDSTCPGHGLCGWGRTTDQYTRSPEWVSCLNCRAKLIDRKKESTMNPMHFGKRKANDIFNLIAVCGEKNVTRITTKTSIVSCPECRVYLNGGTMPKTKDQLAKEMRDTANKLLAQAAEMEREAKRDEPAEPPLAAGHMFKVLVRFATGSGRTYPYLLLRTGFGGKWFTTGTSANQRVFENWKELVAWLEGPDINYHGAVIRIVEAEDKRPGYLGPNKYYKFGKKFL